MYTHQILEILSKRREPFFCNALYTYVLRTHSKKYFYLFYYENFSPRQVTRCIGQDQGQVQERHVQLPVPRVLDDQVFRRVQDRVQATLYAQRMQKSAGSGADESQRDRVSKMHQVLHHFYEDGKEKVST